MENKKLITAKELFDKMLEENVTCTSTKMMIEFAKIHVEEALKYASERALLEIIPNNDITYYERELFIENFQGNNQNVFINVSEELILNSYSLNNIV